jgi:DNA-binding MarR family transcriptional regulator
MHTLGFALKRGFQSWLRQARALLRTYGITPARYDMLFAIDDAPGGVLLQSALRPRLGVTAPTISTMLTSLEDLGLVRRAVYVRDRRERVVRLTMKGKRCLVAAEYELVTSGAVDLAFDCALCGPLACHPWLPAVRGRALEEALCGIRYEFRDVATLRFSRDGADPKPAWAA